MDKPTITPAVNAIFQMRCGHNCAARSLAALSFSKVGSMAWARLSARILSGKKVDLIVSSIPRTIALVSTCEPRFFTIKSMLAIVSLHLAWVILQSSSVLVAELVMFKSRVAVLGIGATYWQMKRHFDKTLADEISAEKYTLKNNKNAFQQLAKAGAPVYVARASDSNGVPIPSGYCLYIPNAQGADMKDGNGRIFFVSSRPESELKQLLDVQQQQ